MSQDQCLFCQISSGSVPSHKVFEDDKCFAFLDINPANPGHVVLMPKEHYTIMPQVPDEIMGHLGVVSQDLSRKLIGSLKAKGTNVFVANGAAGGQKAQHFMLHIIPRVEDDGVNFDLRKVDLSGEQVAVLKQKIAPAITKTLGFQMKVPAGSLAPTPVPTPPSSSPIPSKKSSSTNSSASDIDALTEFLTK